MSEIIKLTDLKSGIMGIYKINYPNGKIYIGLSNDIKRRMCEHNSEARLISHKEQPPCDLAIQKYGKINEIEILEYINDPNILEERERYWISYYNSTDKKIGYNLTSGGEHLSGPEHPRAVFNEEEVLDIRKRRFNGERKINVYNSSYSDKSFSTFEKIWLGSRYQDIGREFLIPIGSKTRQEYSSIANTGANNGRAKLTENDVREIRNKYDNLHLTYNEILLDYPNVTKNTIIRICKRETWKNVI